VRAPGNLDLRVGGSGSGSADRGINKITRERGGELEGGEREAESIRRLTFEKVRE